MFEAAADFRWLHAEPEHRGYAAVNDARERMFQSINHRDGLYLGASACLFSLL
ncbi:MAG: hypothetical protein M3Z20_13145 [Chloroflexota bacterium]|nr:hypothetical protein [Chloroflexota bacterium]